MSSFLSRLFISLTSVKYGPYIERDATENFERWFQRHKATYQPIADLTGCDPREYARLCSSRVGLSLW